MDTRRTEQNMVINQQEMNFPVPSREERRWAVSPDNPDFPLNRFIGNREAVRRLGRAVFSALGEENRCCADYSFAICGPASTGKTYLAKLFAESVGIPFVTIEPQSVRRVQDIFEEICRVCEEQNEGLRVVPNEDGGYILPPMVVFIDEVHNLRKGVVQGLLKATEPNDRSMVTEEGLIVSTENVCWMIATTDRGDLFDAFDTRFQKVNLRLYTKREMARIIKMNNPDWDDEVCLLVAKYNSHVPREALAFARDMRVEHEMNGDVSWKEAAKIVAKDHGIDRWGMTESRVEVLKALGQRAIASTQLQYVVHVKEEELRKFVMPPLLARTPGQEPLVTVSTRGYTITPGGISELEKRGLPHRGLDAMPRQIREMYASPVAEGE
jgi:Holliday junction resolvasome RuvABC ATP-dependent DNA helicase subunit